MPLALAAAAIVVAGVGQPLLSSAQAERSDTPAIDLTSLVEAIAGNAAAVQAGTEAAVAGAQALAHQAEVFSTSLPAITALLSTDPEAGVAALQGSLTSFATSAALTGVTQALSVTSKVLTPTCANLAILADALSPVSGLLQVPSALFGPLGPVVDQLNRGVSDALYTFYSQAIATALAPPSIPGLPLPPGVPSPTTFLGLAQALLSVIAFDYTTEYQPASGPAVKRTYKGFSGLPSLLDVDDKPGVDVCATTTFDIASFLANPTAPLKITQSISRVPLSNLNLGYKITAGALAGALPVGYDTLGSKAPIGFDSTTSLAITSVTSTTTTKMLKPPTGKFVQNFGLSAALSQIFTSTKAPTAYEAVSRLALPSTVAYTANAESDSFTYGLRTVSSTTSSSTGTKTDTDSTAKVSQTPGRKSFQYCYAPASGPAPIGNCRKPGMPAAATGALNGLLEKGMSFAASDVVDIAATVSGTKKETPTSGPVVVTSLDTPATGCQATTPATFTNNNMRLKGKAMWLDASNLGPLGAGFGFIDTPNGSVNGCLATAGVTGTLPTGFTATNARVEWLGALAVTAKVTSRTGTTTCAPNLSTGTNGTDYYLPFCAVVPTNSVLPSISGTPKIGQQLTVNPGTWGPVNAGPFLYTYQRCTTPTSGCSTINFIPTTNATYTPSTGTSSASNDTGKYIRVVVTGKNFEPGSSPTATSATVGPVTPAGP